MNKRAFGIVAASALAVVALAAPAAAGQPENPGVFGTIRADNIQSGNIPAGPGGSGMGVLASERAGTNGDLNQEWKIAHGGAPTTP
jgi:hypothetical protein